MGRNEFKKQRKSEYSSSNIISARGKKQNRNLRYISDLTDNNKGLYEFTSVHALEKIVPVLMIFW